ncbi:vacuolar fusion protein mon1 [Zalerion maritima]|uniref:Vacuolar fusion protein MON1 n=1 Tax=Zalerion maritima TaxID=339359 RepID=A0AAD5WX58_9PEZI|nr:vacuolar fusion protein mon1 [Zalerion maritima]
MAEDGGKRAHLSPPGPSAGELTHIAHENYSSSQENKIQSHSSKLVTRPNVGDESNDGPPPPLPPRPGVAPSPQAATTKVQSIDVQTLQFPDGSRGTFQTPGARAMSTPVQLAANSGSSTPGRSSTVDADDAMSVMSIVAPTLRPPGDLASLMVSDMSRKSPAWQLLRSQSASVKPFETVRLDVRDSLADFAQEFEPVPGTSEQGGLGDEQRLAVWKSKLKHYMILSSSGKPIYSRHGDLSVVNSFMGVIQTIISFYEGADNPLQGFTAGGTRFVIVTEGPLYFVAISRLGESDAQLRSQLEALYMQILSTLTLPNLTSIFAHRPNTDLQKPLAGTEPLLSSLADSFTRGSPSVLLSALECLKLRKSHRASITSAFLKSHAGGNLLYGMIVAGGRLVSVIRPRQHSLHPSDLQLVFNMLFESGGIRSGEGENWIPICLPAFNNRGYLYMYVSFFDAAENTAPSSTSNSSDAVPEAIPFSPTHPTPQATSSDSIAIILISPSPTSFYDLQSTRNNLVSSLTKGPLLSHIRTSIQSGRPSLTTQISPGTPLSHFLYKSRANVQFCMPSSSPQFDSPLPRRKLMSLYHSLHGAVHARHCHLKVLHSVADDSTSLAWITPTFELYCVAGPNVSRAAMTQGANRIVQWAKREEERLFIIGGGVF